MKRLIRPVCHWVVVLDGIDFCQGLTFQSNTCPEKRTNPQIDSAVGHTQLQKHCSTCQNMKDKAKVEEMGKREKFEEKGRAVVARRGTNTAKSEEDPPQGTTSETSGNIMT